MVKTLMVLERVPDVWLTESEREDGLCFESYNAEMNFNQWERGRLFGKEFELRWEKEGGVCQGVYCGAPVNLPGFTREEIVQPETLTLHLCTYDLWGSRVRSKDLELLGGTITCDECGDCAAAQPQFNVVQGGQWVIADYTLSSVPGG